MDYNSDMYEEDKRIANYVYLKKFRNYQNYKDDLIQTCIIALYRARQMFDESKSNYMTYAVKACFYTMLRFIDKENKKNNYGLNLSFDFELCEDFELENVLGYDVDFCENIILNELKQKILKIILNRHYKINDINYRNKRKKNLRAGEKVAIDYFINELSEKELIKKYNVTRQAISAFIVKYRKKIQEELNMEDLLL